MESNADIAANAVFGVVTIVVGGVFILVAIAITVAIILFLQSCLKRLPERHRQADVNLIWLLIIPLVNLVWNFFVFPKIAKSYQAYFAEQGVQDVGDCGERLSLAYCIVAACTLVLGWLPCVNVLISIAALVLLIMSLLKFYQLKARVTPET